MLERFMKMLQHHPDPNMRSLKDRINFNEHYKGFVLFYYWIGTVRANVFSEDDKRREFARKVALSSYATATPAPGKPAAPLVST